MPENEIILNSTPDKAIYWSGNPVPELGIEKNMSYTQVLELIVKDYLSLKNSKFDVGKLGTDLSSRDDAINSLLEKVNTLSTDDISHNGIPFNNNKLSVEASKFLGSKFNYSITADPTFSAVATGDFLKIDPTRMPAAPVDFAMTLAFQRP